MRLSKSDDARKQVLLKSSTPWLLINASRTKPHRQSMLPVTTALDPKTGLTVVTMLSWSCLVKRFTSRRSFSASSHSSRAPAVKQSPASNYTISTADVSITAGRSAVYPSLMPQQLLCSIPIWHPQLQPQSARRLCRVPRWGLWRGRCRSREIPASTYHRGWRHQAAELRLYRCTRKTVRCVLNYRWDQQPFL